MNLFDVGDELWWRFLECWWSLVKVLAMPAATGSYASSLSPAPKQSSFQCVNMNGTPEVSVVFRMVIVTSAPKPLQKAACRFSPVQRQMVQPPAQSARVRQPVFVRPPIASRPASFRSDLKSRESPQSSASERRQKSS